MVPAMQLHGIEVSQQWNAAYIAQARIHFSCDQLHVVEERTREMKLEVECK
jgi:hypothetical protein